MQLPLHYTYCLETNTTRKSICRAQKEPNMKNVMINLFQITGDHLNDIDPYHIIETRIELRFLIIYDFFEKSKLIKKKGLSLFDNNEIIRSSRVNSGLIMRVVFCFNTKQNFVPFS